MSFIFKECKIDNVVIDGLFEITPKIFNDNRGYVFESYNALDFQKRNIYTQFVQDNQSYSHKNCLHGLHFQTNKVQAKLVRVILGKVYDVVVDLRNGSNTFGKYFATILDSKKQNQLYIPKGFAHGFYSIEDCIFAYKCDDFYDPQGESGIIWNDKTINIDWPLNGNVPILSEKDKKHHPFSKNKAYFSMDGVKEHKTMKTKYLQTN